MIYIFASLSFWIFYLNIGKINRSDIISCLHEFVDAYEAIRGLYFVEEIYYNFCG